MRFIVVIFLLAHSLPAMGQSRHSGGLPVSVATSRLKSGGTVLTVRRTAGRSKRILKMLDFANGQPVGLVANRHVIISVNGRKNPTAKEFKQACWELNSFVVEVCEMSEKKFRKNACKNVLVLTTKSVAQRKSKAEALGTAYLESIRRADRLIDFQLRELAKLSFALRRNNNMWQTFDRKNEIWQALSVVDLGRKRLEAAARLLENERPQKGSSSSAVDSFITSLDLLNDRLVLDKKIEQLKLFQPLYEEVRKQKLNAIEQEERRAQLVESIESFQSKMKDDKERRRIQAAQELEYLQLQKSLLSTQYEIAVEGVLVQHAIDTQEINDYNAWVEDHNRQVEEEADQEYFESIDYDGNWSDYQMMHSTQRMLRNSFHGNNTNYRPATDGRP